MIEISQRHHLFNDPTLQDSFNRDGFVIIRLLDEHQVKTLNALYKKMYPQGVEGFFTTTFENDPEHRKTVSQSIQKICKARLDEIFKEYKIMFSSFIVKAPDEKSELILHQDMTLVDESKFTGTNVWCPLIDLDEQNGAIQLIPQSHRFYFTYRGASLPDIYDNVKDYVKNYLKPLYLKAGEAVIFDQSIIHYSPRNESQRERPVINTFVTSTAAKINICYWDKESSDEIEIFEQKDDFLENFENFGHNIFKRPTIGRSLGKTKYHFPLLTEQIIKKELGLEEKRSMWTRIMKRFRS